MARVVFDNVSFDYPIFGLTSRSFKVTLMRSLPLGSRLSNEGVVHVEALRDVSFRAEAGDRLGLIGHNGAGKSTSLRLIAGLAYPNKGKVEVTGRIIPLIEKGLGINPELSGRDNIELPLRLLGATSAEVKRAMEEIPEFTGLGEFIDVPVRAYSEGMKTRLAFGVSTFLEADVLVLDEWLGAGDIDFQEKAEARLTTMLAKTGVVVVTSHSMHLIRKVCTHCLWFHQGRVRMEGHPDEVTAAYEAHSLRQAQEAQEAAEAARAAAQ